MDAKARLTSMPLHHADAQPPTPTSASRAPAAARSERPVDEGAAQHHGEAEQLADREIDQPAGDDEGLADRDAGRARPTGVMTFAEVVGGRGSRDTSSSAPTSTTASSRNADRGAPATAARRPGRPRPPSAELGGSPSSLSSTQPNLHGEVLERRGVQVGRERRDRVLHQRGPDSRGERPGAPSPRRRSASPCR